MQPGEFRYWAFISYSHADEAWASWLHKALESYRVPERLRGRAGPAGAIPAKLFPVFRDRDELAGSSSLGPELRKALESSRALIAICSPKAAQSRWVGEEIQYFKSLGRSDRVFALIVDGEPHASDKGAPEQECFPQALRFELGADGAPGSTPAEPIAADARRHGDGKANAKLKLIAGILGLGFDDLKQRELQARNRRLGIVAALATGIAALTIVLAIQAYAARNDAQRRQRQAEDLIQFMLGDLRKKLEPLGKLEILDSVGDKAMDYFATLDEADRTDAVLTSRATALRQIGEVRLKQGSMEGATEAFQGALALDAELVARHPDDVLLLLNISRSQYSVGYAHYSKGEIDQALVWFERQRETVARLVTLQPDDRRWQAELGDANVSLGGIAAQRGEFAKAREHFEAARHLQTALVEHDPKNQELILALCQTYGWLTHIESVQRRYPAALVPAQQRVDLQRRLSELAPDNAEYRLQLASSLQQAEYNRTNFQPADPEAPGLREALKLTADLAALDPANIEYVRAHAVSLSYLEDAFLATGRTGPAIATNAEFLAVTRDLFRRSSGNSQTVDDLVNAMLRTVKLAYLSGDRKRALNLLAETERLPLNTEQRFTMNPNRWFELHLLGQWMAPDAKSRAAHAAQARDWLKRAESSERLPSPELMLRYHVLAGNTAAASAAAGKLSAAERAQPYLVQFCREKGCPGI